ncbi:telomeric repeat binding factor a isoform X2 [Centropristis striata]|uniref:telomeric repeat binding factor a isoform X2 n=1 Tax=Centropristis striata TaxID=184440 RepID=UPI0027DEB26F|nr:telomeric repeat binding factor a isoform X2 [Centropristis striata]
MAAKDSSSEVEAFVNRWIVDYYVSLAVELFENKQYDAVVSLKEVLDSVLARCVAPTDLLPVKIRIFEFLCHIIDGEKPDTHQSTTPLESALMLLESMSQDYHMPQQDFNNVCTSLKEMMVGILIKNKMFDKAKEMVNKHFPKSMFEKKAIFMRLINKKSKMHEVIEQIDFQRFREEMLTFCRSICTFGVPFLHKAAKQLIDQKFVRGNGEAGGSDELEEAGPSSDAPICTVQFVIRKHTIIQKTRLEAAFKALAASSVEIPFTKLEEEVESEEQARTNNLSLRLLPSPKKGTNGDSEQDEFFHRDSGSPMEASPADQPPQTDASTEKQAGLPPITAPKLRDKQPYTVARLVVEPDSQGSSQFPTESQEPESDVTTEEPPQSPAINNKKDPQSRETDRRDNITRSRKAKSKRLPSESEETESPCRTPVQEPRKRLASVPSSKDPEAIRIMDSSMDSSDEMFPPSPGPRTSSTPHKDSPQDQGPSHSKWKQLYRAAKESKEVWSDEESYFNSRKGSRNESTLSNSGKKKKWSNSETEKLKEGVRKFGEGNWTKIKSYYNFTNRTNVNLKDRWRTLKKLNMV